MGFTSQASGAAHPGQRRIVETAHMMVTRLAWMASRLVSVNKDTCMPRNDLSLYLCSHSCRVRHWPEKLPRQVLKPS